MGSEGARDLEEELAPRSSPGHLTDFKETFDVAVHKEEHNSIQVIIVP